MHFLHTLTCEWRKAKGTAGSWLILVGALLLPSITILIRFYHRRQLPAFYQQQQFWEKTLLDNWQTMAMLLLPMGIILCASLITQIEYKNNTWKQLHTTPQRFSHIYFAKAGVLLILLLQFFLLFNLGIILSGLVPLLFNSQAALPDVEFPVAYYISQNSNYFVAALPMVAIQFLLSLHFRNFLVPLGAGLVLLVASLFAIQWKMGYLLPYTYTAYHYLMATATQTRFNFPADLRLIATLAFTIVIGLGFLLYKYKKDKC
jgi:lantibiotic transport system permease protein